jgi:hypothetical protein
MAALVAKPNGEKFKFLRVAGHGILLAGIQNSHVCSRVNCRCLASPSPELRRPIPPSTPFRSQVLTFLHMRFARLAGSLTLKNKLSPEKYALLAPAWRPALHFLWKIHIQGNLSSIHIAKQLKAKQCKRSKTAKR